MLLDNHLAASHIPVCFENIRCGLLKGRPKPRGHQFYQRLHQLSVAVQTGLNRVFFADELKQQCEFSCVLIVFFFTLNMIYL